MLGLEKSDSGRRDKGEEVESEGEKYNKHWKCGDQIKEMNSEDHSGDLMHTFSPITLDLTWVYTHQPASFNSPSAPVPRLINISLGSSLLKSHQQCSSSH